MYVTSSKLELTVCSLYFLECRLTHEIHKIYSLRKFQCVRYIHPYKLTADSMQRCHTLGCIIYIRRGSHMLPTQITSSH